MSVESTRIAIISLFASSSTLICCALPALFVFIGAGASFASLVNIFPQLIIISQYKIQISIGTLIILLIAGVLIKKSDSLPCPIDPKLRNICLKTRKKSKAMYYISVIIFLSASFFTYLLPTYL
tara:strand:+ start:1969 stop:2340 length:372 start_codon:yes stop_codon:yes gene_type:complete